MGPRWRPRWPAACWQQSSRQRRIIRTCRVMQLARRGLGRYSEPTVRMSGWRHDFRGEAFRGFSFSEFHSGQSWQPGQSCKTVWTATPICYKFQNVTSEKEPTELKGVCTYEHRDLYYSS